MGGKNKQSQRTKNNARPSSSCRSAELLGSTLPQFVGFSALKENSSAVPSFSLTPDDKSTTLDSNFQLVFKKMNKKDSTTKLKALNEFIDLLKSSEIEAIKAVLPFWPRLYCILATDAKHKVREAAHIAHNEIIIKAKKNLAPFLKQLIGPWFVAQYDTYAPAASTATKAFEDAFPQNKKKEAIIFCQEEILSYVCDNLTVHTAQSLNSSKSVLAEEAEARYEIILISSLGGYALYLNEVPTEQIEKLLELNLKILSNNKFWKLSKHKSAPVKAAWFSVISAICQNSPSLVEKVAVHFVGAVFTNIDERDAMVLPSVWEAVLSVLSSVIDWWKHVNVEKLVLPKLWNILREGGRGNATILFPNLLPIISQLPDVDDKITLYSTLFDSMRIGLKQKSVIGSRSESLATSEAFMECLQYIILKNQKDIALCDRLIKFQLIPILEWSLTDAEAPFKNIFNQISKLVQYWSRNIHNADFPHYTQYLNSFWNNVTSLFQGLLMNLEHHYVLAHLTLLASRYSEFLQSLKHISKSKKQLKVTFTNDKPSEEIDITYNSGSTNLEESYLNSLHILVYKSCMSYIHYVNITDIKEPIEYLSSLIHDFESHDFFCYLNEHLGGNKDNLVAIYQNLLSKWQNSNTLCSKPVVDITFIIFKYLKLTEKIEVLEGFNSIQDDKCFGWCVAQLLSHPYNADPVVQNWLYSDRVCRFLVNIMEKELTGSCPSELSLILKQSFMEKSNGELFITKHTAINIVQVLTKSLDQPTIFAMPLDTSASFAAYISAILYTPITKLDYGDELLLSMFNLSCSNNIHLDIISEDTIWEVNTAWQDIISILSKELSVVEFQCITLKCAQIVKKAVLSHVNLDQIAHVIISFIKSIDQNNVFNVLDIFLQNEFTSISKKMFKNACICAEYIKGVLSNPYKLLNPEIHAIQDYDLEQYFIWIHLRAHVLTELRTSIKNEDENAWKQKISIENDDLQIFIMRLLYSVTLIDTFIQNYHSIKHCKQVKPKLETIIEKLKAVFINMDENCVQNIEKLLIEKLLKSSWLWTRTLYLFYDKFINKDFKKTYMDLNKKCELENSQLPILHLTQVFANNLNYDQICHNFSFVEKIIILRSLIFCAELDVPIAEAFFNISEWQQENYSQYTYESFLTWDKTEIVIECIRFFSSVLRYKPHCIESKRRDLILISFATWCTNLRKHRNRYTLLQIKSMIAAVSELFSSINIYLKGFGNETSINEWKDIFAKEVHKDLLQLWLYILEKYEEDYQSLSIIDIIFMQEFDNITNRIDHTYLFIKKHPDLPDWAKLIKRCCSLMINSVHTLQLCGYKLILSLLPGLVRLDSEGVKINKPHERGLIFEQFKDILKNTQEIISSMLLDFKLGTGRFEVEPCTDSYTYTFGYLLTWDILLRLCEYSSTEVRFQYADWLKNEDFLNNLLNNIFKLMPLEIMLTTEAKVKHFNHLFSSKFSVLLRDECSSELIEYMVCQIFLSTLTQLPAMVRQWWSHQETRIAQIVERITSTFISPRLCIQELTDVAQHEKKFKNMIIKVHSSVREVIAIYTVDEVQMELVITLPNNYPLGGPDVQCNKQICGNSHRQWLMQLKICVLHQNGRIWDGLLLWNNNLDKKFDGVEECCICYSVLHQGTYQLPRLVCQKCKKKFHSACLYKWFSTSNRSTCPICRNLF